MRERLGEACPIHLAIGELTVAQRSRRKEIERLARRDVRACPESAQGRQVEGVARAHEHQRVTGRDIDGVSDDDSDGRRLGGMGEP